MITDIFSWIDFNPQKKKNLFHFNSLKLITFVLTILNYLKIKNS